MLAMTSFHPTPLRFHVVCSVVCLLYALKTRNLLTQPKLSRFSVDKNKNRMTKASGYQHSPLCMIRTFEIYGIYCCVHKFNFRAYAFAWWVLADGSRCK